MGSLKEIKEGKKKWGENEGGKEKGKEGEREEGRKRKKKIDILFSQTVTFLVLYHSNVLVHGRNHRT